MIQVADERNRPPARARAPFLLRGTSTTCRVQQWSFRADTAQLVLYQQRALPTTADLLTWCGELAALGYTRVRTSAVAGNVLPRLEAAGFGMMQELVLLEHTDIARAAAAVIGDTAATVRLPPVQRRGRQPDRRGRLRPRVGPRPGRAARGARPRHATAPGAGEPLAGYAITGRDGRQGFLQRLAVHPDAQRQGLGLALVADSLAWMARWRVERVLVNTPTDNEAALRLYEHVGYRQLPEPLCVYERGLA